MNLIAAEYTDPCNLSTSATGFDSSLLERTIRSGSPAENAANLPLLKATLGVSVRTLNFDNFKKHYLELLPTSLHQVGATSKKRLYKAAHLAKQLQAKTPMAITNLLVALTPDIDRIDVYCFYTRREYVMVYGNARAEKLSPNQFVDLTQNAFPHVCAWRYLANYQHDSQEDEMMLDHFLGRITPAWEFIENSKFNLHAYYSGAECNPLISIADLTLRLIETFQAGTIGSETLLKPIEDHIPKLKAKLRFHNLGGPGYCLKASAPHLPLDLHLSPFIKHPVFFFAWDPAKPREILKPAFEWSPIYNAGMELACHNNGNVKFLKFDDDSLYWDIEKDFIIAWTSQDLENLEELKGMGHDLPKILTKDQLFAAADKFR